MKRKEGCGGISLHLRCFSVLSASVAAAHSNCSAAFMRKSDRFRYAITIWLVFCLLTGATMATSLQKRELSSTDQAFLEDMSRRLFRYFVEHSDPKTGLTLDRARVDG